MIICDTDGIGPHTTIKDPAGKLVGKVKSINTETGEAVKYVVGEDGKCKTEPLEASQPNYLPRRVSMETVFLLGHEVLIKGELFAVTPLKKII